MELYNDTQTTFLYAGQSADVYVTRSQYKFNGMEWGEQHIFIQGFPGFQTDTRTTCEKSIASTQTNPPEIQTTSTMHLTSHPANVHPQFPSHQQMESLVQPEKTAPTIPQKSQFDFYSPSVKVASKQSSAPTMLEHDVLEHSQNAFLPGPSACFIDNSLHCKLPSFEIDIEQPHKLSTTPRLSSVPITVRTPTIKNSFCTHTNVLSNNRKKLASNAHDIWIRMLYSWMLELDFQMNFASCLKKYLGAYLHPKPNNGPKHEHGELLRFSEIEENSPLQVLEWTRAERRKISEFKQLHPKMDKEEWNYISKNFIKCGKINYNKVPVVKEFANILQDSLKRSNIQKTPSWEAANACSCEAPKLTQAELDKFNSSFLNSSSLASSHTPSITASLTESASASSASVSSSSAGSGTPSIPTANLQPSPSQQDIITVAPVLIQPQPIHPFFKTPANLFNTASCSVKTIFEQLKSAPPAEHNTPTATITESTSFSESELHKSLCQEDFAPRLPPDEVIRLYTCIYLENFQELWNSDVVILQNSLISNINQFLDRHPVMEQAVLGVVFQSIDLYVGIYTELETLPQFT